ncbi:MAG: DHHW family protein, partial [Oscillospiraceae bacterium]
EYPLKEDSVSHAMERLNHIYDKYLTDAKVYMAVIPDKGYYLAEAAGQLALDYDKLFAAVKNDMPWADHIDLTESLSLEDYYRTDTHWRQERLLGTAKVICEALGISAPKAEDYRVMPLERPFHGVYYGQAALPMKPETLYLMESDLLKDCRVYDYETGKYGAVYDQTKRDSRDLYDVYLSGARALLTIENPHAQTDRELIVFRDSFGSSLVPLLVQGYAKVTLVDIRYVGSDLLDQYLDFHGQDVLMMYSTLILNSSSAMK